MNRHCSAVLIILMLFSLCLSGFAACGSPPKELRAGFAMADITPEDSVPLAGYGNSTSRMSQGSLDPIYTTAIAISDGYSTVISLKMTFWLHA